MLEKIIKYSFYLLIFLLPLWFLPWTVFPVALNKQMLLAVFVFLLLIIGWIIEILLLTRRFQEPHERLRAIVGGELFIVND